MAYFWAGVLLGIFGWDGGATAERVALRACGVWDWDAEDGKVEERGES